MIRKIIRIDEEKCNGCGLCAKACHEGAIDIIDGKARLVREHFCDGLGDCLPNCPTGAITFEEREAPEYDEKAVQEAKRKKAGDARPAHHGRHSCTTAEKMDLLPWEDLFPVLPSGPARSSWCRPRPRFLTVPDF